MRTDPPSALQQQILDLFPASSPDGPLYLDSATYGLPPRTTVEVLHRAADAWADGSARWVEDWDRTGEACRTLLGRLLHVPERCVSLQPAVSVATAVVASAVPPGGEVLLAQEDFTSVTYPFLAAEKAGRLRVRAVPLDRLLDAVRSDTDLVAVSAVQSADGRTTDLAALRAVTRDADARLYVDASQALGLLPLDATALGLDYVSCAGYKWLCCPRGVAFLYVAPERTDDPWPLAANWRAGDDPYGRFYGVDLGLAPDGARFDVSLAWHAWVGAETSLRALVDLGDDLRFARGRGAACRLAELLDLPKPGAGIVTVPVTDTQRVADALERAGVRVSLRAGMVRVSFHLYNRPDEAERVAEMLGPFRCA